MSLWGYTTKRDLTGFGNFLFMGLIGILLASLANFFFKSPAINFVISILGVLIFTGLTAWDTQKIKNTYYAVGGDTAVAGKAAIMGALSLYLDFLNIFLFLLRFMGNRAKRSETRIKKRPGAIRAFFFSLSMGGLEPPIQGYKRRTQSLLLWMAGQARPW